MMTFEFIVIASGLDPQDEDFESRFYDGRCDDATVSFQKGRIIVDFARTADSIEDAISSAVRDVRAIGARVDRVEPDPLVSLSDIATRAAMSRAAITQYAKGQRCQDFPAPVARVTSDSPLYDWAAVACWLYEHHKLTRDAVVEAEVVSQANLVLISGGIDFETCLKQRLDAYRARVAA